MTKGEKKQEMQREFLNHFPETVGVCVDTNKAGIVGTIDKPFQFSHELCGEKIFETVIKVPRLNQISDYIPVKASEEMLSFNLCDGQSVKVVGEFCSWSEQGRLNSYLQAEHITQCNSLPKKFNNMIYLAGRICKEPKYKKSFKKRRDITELLIAVNGKDGENYIPCIAWDTNAVFASFMEVGDYIQIWGRMQSREFYKRGELTKIFEVSMIDFS